MIANLYPVATNRTNATMIGVQGGQTKQFPAELFKGDKGDAGIVIYPNKNALLADTLQIVNTRGLVLIDENQRPAGYLWDGSVWTKTVVTGYSTILTDADIVDIFIYDTKKDTIPDTWRYNSLMSWYSEPSSVTRGTKKEFPEVAVLIATTTKLYIFDYETGSLWMQFNSGNNGTSGSAMIGYSNNSSVFANNGKVWVTKEKGTSGHIDVLASIDFSNDVSRIFTIVAYYATYPAMTGKKYQIANRNLTTTFDGTVLASISGLNTYKISGSGNYVAVASDSGINIIDDFTGKVLSCSDTSKFFSARISPDGYLYAIKDNDRAIYRSALKVQNMDWVGLTAFSLNDILTSAIYTGSKAVKLDGTDDYVSVADNAGINFATGDFTIEMSFNFTSLVAGNCTLIDKGTLGSGAGYAIYVVAATRKIVADIATVNNVYTLNTNYVIDINKNYHVSVVVSRASGVYIYVNGSLIYSNTSITSGTGTTTNASTLYFGRNFVSDYAAVKVYKIRLWNYALSASRIYDFSKGALLKASDKTWGTGTGCNVEYLADNYDASTGTWKSTQNAEGGATTLNAVQATSGYRPTSVAMPDKYAMVASPKNLTLLKGGKIAVSMSNNNVTVLNGTNQYWKRDNPVDLDFNGAELMANGTFEVNTTNVGQTGTSHTFARVTSDFHSGVASLQVTATGTGDASNYISLTTGVLETGKKYTLELWAKSVSGNTSFNSNIAGALGAKTVTINSSTWTKIAATFISTFSGTSNVRINLSGVGVCLVDDVSLTEAYDFSIIANCTPVGTLYEDIIRAVFASGYLLLTKAVTTNRPTLGLWDGALGLNVAPTPALALANQNIYCSVDRTGNASTFISGVLTSVPVNFGKLVGMSSIAIGATTAGNERWSGKIGRIQIIKGIAITQADVDYFNANGFQNKDYWSVRGVKLVMDINWQQNDGLDLSDSRNDFIPFNSPTFARENYKQSGEEGGFIILSDLDN